MNDRDVIEPEAAPTGAEGEPDGVAAADLVDTPPSDSVELSLGELVRRVEDAVATWEEDLSSSLTDRLRAALAEARDRHGVLLDELEPSRISPGSADESRAVRRYREAFLDEVLDPLLEVLEGLQPSAVLQEGLRGLSSRVTEATASLPEELRRPRLAGSYDRLPGDGVWTRTRKWQSRRTRGLAALFGNRRVLEHTVPLRRLASRLVRVEGVPRLAGIVNDLELHHSRALLELEEALRAWHQSWFGETDAVRRPDSHLDEAVRDELSELQDRLIPVLRELGGETPEDATPEPPPQSDTGERPATSDDVEAPDGARWEAARTLHGAFDLLAELPAPEASLTEFRQGVEDLLARLSRHSAHVGTPAELRIPGSWEARERQTRAQVKHIVARWTSWEEGFLGRLRLVQSVLALRGDLDRELDRYLGTVLEDAVLGPIRSLAMAQESLRALRAEWEAKPIPADGEAGRTELVESGERLRDRAATILAEASAALEPARTQDRVRASADRAVESVSEVLRGVPETFRVHAPAQGQDVYAEQDLRSVNLREILQQSLDILHLDGLRNAPRTLLRELEEARVACLEVPTVIEYNAATAKEVLEKERPADPVGGDPAEASAEPTVSILEEARSLTLDALTRSVQTLDHVQARLLEPWPGFIKEVHEIVRRGLSQTHERLVMQRAVQEQLLDVRTQLLAWLRRARAGLNEAWDQWLRRARRQLRRLYVRALRLIRRGRAAVGTEQVQEGEAERALEVLRGIPALLAPLPLVYRRLFSFQPVTDPALLVGREAEVAWVGRRYTAWREGMRSPGLLVGPSTIGQTSLLNVLAETTFRDARVARVTFPFRPRSEETLAEHLQGLLERAGLLNPASGPVTLDGLATRLLAAGEDDPSRPKVILVEHLPHLFLRVPGGFGLAARFLDLQVRTSPSIFWLSSVNDSAWKLLQKCEPRVGPLLSQGQVPPLDRAQVERLILLRHQRSGVPLDFLEPPNVNPLLRRRLQRAGSEEARQELLQEEFFDRLFRGSRGNAVMAILLWLKSADFAPKDGWLQLRTPRPIRFGFLEEMDLALDFALKALLEHGSLTMDEYAQVLRTDEAEAHRTFEALRSRMLVEPWDTGGGAPVLVQNVEPGIRYRIPPVLTNVVSDYLRRSNIQH